MDTHDQWPEPIIMQSNQNRDQSSQLISAAGRSFEIHEWGGGGPDYLHVHYEDDEAWHVLEGTLTFRFADREIEAPAGTTVFVPSGVPHTYDEAGRPSS